MERDFKQWLALFRTSIANYQYYTYFDKVFSNVDAIKVELNLSLIHISEPTRP